jgi:hypothetical protein
MAGSEKIPANIGTTPDGTLKVEDPSMGQEEMTLLRLVLLIFVVLLLLGSLPIFPYSAGWGYYPSGGLGTILIVLVILAVMGVI